jgi:hypothetical protein
MSLATSVGFALLFTASWSPLAAQGLGWSIAPSVILDTEFADGTELGPGITGEIELRAASLVSYTAAVSFARTDFPVGVDDLHRNFGSVAFGARLMPPREGPSVGLLLGIGAFFWDDVSETDPGFRSSADAEEMLVPGLELRWPIRDGFGVTLSVRDQVTGWWWAIIDPSEGELNHVLMIGVGLYHG